MTDNEIIKALECCADGYCDTGNCPYSHIDDINECTSQMAQTALYLINRLTAENANLTSRLTSLQNDLTSAKEMEGNNNGRSNMD